jgi:hypothetical protein
MHLICTSELTGVTQVLKVHHIRMIRIKDDFLVILIFNWYSWICALWMMRYKYQQDAALQQNLPFQSLSKAQHVSSRTPLIIRSSKLCLQHLVYIPMWWLAIAKAEWENQWCIEGTINLHAFSYYIWPDNT